jgi:hypothetical protein
MVNSRQYLNLHPHPVIPAQAGTQRVSIAYGGKLASSGGPSICRRVPQAQEAAPSTPMKSGTLS